MAFSAFQIIEQQANTYFDNFANTLDDLQRLYDETGDVKALECRNRLLARYQSKPFWGDPASDNNGKSEGRVFMHGDPESKPHNSKRNYRAKPARPREEMTLRCKGSVTEGHLTMLHLKLIEEGWIDCIEGDFKALFSGKRDEACTLTWLGKFGNGTLVELFRQLVGEGLVIVPKGYSLPYILEGHFKDQEGKWLTRLDKGDKAHDKALPVIQECVDLLKMNVKQLIQKMRGVIEDEDEDFKSAYDPYDHQDLNIHKW